MSESSHDNGMVETERASQPPVLTKPASSRPTGMADILEGPITPTLWKFALPLIVGFFVNSLYGWVDIYFVSKLGVSAIAAMGFVEQLNFFIFNFGSGFAIGASIIVARRIGEKNIRAAEEVTRQAVFFVLLFGAALTACLLVCMPFILSSLGLEGEPLALAQSYMRVGLFGVPGLFTLFLVNSIVRSTGNSMLAMKVILSTVILNSVLDPLFIFGFGPIPAMGVAGAALATAIAQITGATISIYALFAGWVGFTIEKKIPKIDFSIVRAIIRLGIPAMLQMFSISLSRMSLLTVANGFGTAIVAAYSLGIKADFFVFMPIFAVGVAIEVITGQHLGAKKIERIFQFYRAAVQQLALGVLVLSLLVYIFAEKFAHIFTQEPEVVKEVVSYLRIVAFSYPLFVVGIVSTRVISGAGAAIRSMLIVAGSMLCVMLPLAYTLSQWTPLKEEGLWLGILIGYIVFASIAYYNVRSKVWLSAKV